MRKYRAPLGWPQRDPRRYRFPVPNEVWEYKLRPTEFVILSYLCCRQAHDRGEKKICVQAVANSLHLTTATVEKHLTALVSKCLITEDGALMFKCEAGKFFTFPNEVFLLALPPSAFLAYAYLLYCEDRRTHQCHPSYRTIAGTTGLSLNTAVKSVGILAEWDLITVERSCWFNEVGMKRNGNNIYTIRPIREAVGRYNERQLRQLELDAEQERIRKRQEEYSRRRPTAALCTAPATRAALEPIPVKQTSVWPSESACEGRKEKQDKRRTPQAAPAITTSARSAGS